VAELLNAAMGMSDTAVYDLQVPSADSRAGTALIVLTLIANFQPSEDSRLVVAALWSSLTVSHGSWQCCAKVPGRRSWSDRGYGSKMLIFRATRFSFVRASATSLSSLRPAFYTNFHRPPLSRSLAQRVRLVDNLPQLYEAIAGMWRRVWTSADHFGAGYLGFSRVSPGPLLPLRLWLVLCTQQV
jgi:hypothetical protein